MAISIFALYRDYIESESVTTCKSEENLVMIVFIRFCDRDQKVTVP